MKQRTASRNHPKINVALRHLKPVFAGMLAVFAIVFLIVAQNAVAFSAASEEKPMPKLIKQVAPEYPDSLRKAGISGRVIIKAMVDTTGKVIETEVVKSVSGLDKPALDAARLFLFEPAIDRGKKVQSTVIIPFQFKLNKK